MTRTENDKAASWRLFCGLVVRVEEAACHIVGKEGVRSVGYATVLPSPRTERFSPGHLVAVATAPDGSEAVIWRWYDAVVVGGDADLIRLWEPAHGEIVARPRHQQQVWLPGTRAYVSAGLPGADWWVAGSAVARAEDAAVELDEVDRFYTDNELWSRVVPADVRGCCDHSHAQAALRHQGLSTGRSLPSWDRPEELGCAPRGPA